MKNSQCIIWPYLLDRDGYGVVKIKGKMKKAHRVAKEIEIGRRLSKDEIVMHNCHNRACYNSKHLKIGTVKENSYDTIKTRNSQASRLLSGYEKLY